MPTIAEVFEDAKAKLDAGEVAAVGLVIVGRDSSVTTSTMIDDRAGALKLVAALDIAKDRMKADISGQAAS